MQTADTTAAAGQPASPSIIPAIGALWPAQGGYFAGFARGVDGQPDHLLILAADKPRGRLAWQPAMDWAAALGAYGFNEWSLPTRAESALLFANIGDQIDPTWHWTSEELDSSYAWIQSFGYGHQGSGGKSYEGRARAVRRLAINPSILEGLSTP